MVDLVRQQGLEGIVPTFIKTFRLEYLLLILRELSRYLIVMLSAQQYLIIKL
jgi:hypothetical protein